jgi:hypothetical protein
LQSKGTSFQCLESLLLLLLLLRWLLLQLLLWLLLQLLLWLLLLLLPLLSVCADTQCVYVVRSPSLCRAQRIV